MAQQTVSPSANNFVTGNRIVQIKRSGEANFIHIGRLSKADPTPNIDARDVELGVSGSMVLVKRRTRIKSVDWAVETYERTLENLRLWYQGGSTSAWTQSASLVVSGDSKTIVDMLLDVAAYTDIVAGRYYPVAAADGTTRIRRLDPATPPTISGLVEGTGFFVDYENGMIALAAAPGSALAATWKWLAIAGSSFSPWYYQGLDNCVAEILTVGEDGKILEVATIPLCRLESDSADAMIINDEAKLQFKLVQLKHPTSGWGTAYRADVG
jgi:hypothetical protein